MERKQLTKLVERPLLFQRFHAGMNRKLTMVEAPAGYGKTTLMKSWKSCLDELGIKTVWQSVDRDENEASNLLERLLSDLLPDAATQIAQKGRVRSSEVMDVNVENAFFVVSEILHAVNRQTCVFLDDFHESSPFEAEVVRRLIQHLKGQVHIVLGTREPPRFPLAKLRLMNEVTDFGMDELKFNRAETERLFSGIVPDEVIHSYFEYSEGWIAALQLMRLSSKDDAPIDLHEARKFGQHSEIANYLNEQFFQQLGEDQKSFLLDTAHLQSINGDLVDFVRQRTDSWDMLTNLSLSHSLVFEQPYSGGQWYRYHQLLRDFLLKKQHLRGEKELVALHIRAARWLCEHGRLNAAIKHAIKAGSPDIAAQMILDAGSMRIGIREGSLRLASCLEQIPLKQINSSPRLSIARAYLLLKSARIGEAALHIAEVRENADPADGELNRELIMVEAHLRLYEDQHLSVAQLAALEHTAKSTPVRDQMMRGLLFNFLCIFYLQAGRLEEAWNAGETAMALYQDMDALHLQFFMHIHLSVIDLDLGRYTQAYEQRKIACKLCREHFNFDPGLRAIADMFFSEIAYESNETEGLEELVSSALDQADRSEGWSEVLLAGYETCLTLSYDSDGYAAAIEHVARAEVMIARCEKRWFSRQIKILQLDLAVRAGVEAEARRLANSIRSLIAENNQQEGLRWRGQILARLALARFEARYGKPTEAMRILETLDEECKVKGLVRYLLRVQILKTIVSARSQDKQTATQSLSVALSLSGEWRFIGAFLREGDAFAQAAKWTICHAGIAIYATKEVSLLAEILWTLAGKPGTTGSTILAELLTEKEFTVLKQLVEGHANKVIARGLDLSEPTVKFHLQNIYKKLGVNSRKMAAELAVKHGLVTLGD